MFQGFRGCPTVDSRSAGVPPAYIKNERGVDSKSLAGGTPALPGKGYLIFINRGTTSSARTRKDNHNRLFSIRSFASGSEQKPPLRFLELVGAEAPTHWRFDADAAQSQIVQSGSAGGQAHPWLIGFWPSLSERESGSR